MPGVGSAVLQSNRTAEKLTGLQESRRQGTLNFPCTIYGADSDSKKTDGPFVVNPHWHTAVEILYFERGTYLLNVDMITVEIDRECFGFVNAGSLHMIRQVRNEEGSFDFSEKALLFEPHILESAGADDAAAHLLDPLQSGSMIFPDKIDAANPCFEEFKREYLNILEIYRTNGVQSGDQFLLSGAAPQLRVRASMMNMLAALEEQHLLQFRDKKEDERIRDLKKVMLYIRQNYADRIYLSDLAKIMNMNEQYFCRFFKKQIGVTPIAYINEFRIRQAARMLNEHPQVSIAEVALECGFGNMGHFIEEFKKQTGEAPLEFRKKGIAGNPYASSLAEIFQKN